MIDIDDPRLDVLWRLMARAGFDRGHIVPDEIALKAHFSQEEINCEKAEVGRLQQEWRDG